jgi:hypothetical protein
MKPLLASFVALLGACSTSPAQRDESPLSPSHFKGNATAYDGRDVLVRGYVILSTNGRSLCDSKQKFEQWVRALERHADDFRYQDYEGLCLTMLNADTVLKNERLFSRQTITVHGRFMKDYPGAAFDLQAWGENAIVLDDADVRRVLTSLRRGYVGYTAQCPASADIASVARQVTDGLGSKLDANVYVEQPAGPIILDVNGDGGSVGQIVINYRSTKMIFFDINTDKSLEKTIRDVIETELWQYNCSRRR